MAVTHREMEDATLSGKQVKINKNRFLFPACALHYHIFMCVYTCVCIQFPQQTRKSFFSAAAFPSFNPCTRCVPNMVNINWNVLTSNLSMYELSHSASFSYCKIFLLRSCLRKQKQNFACKGWKCFFDYKNGVIFLIS